MNKKLISVLGLSAVALGLVGCQTPDTTAPVIESVSTSSTSYYTNEPFAITVVASDEVSETLTYSVSITAPSGATSTSGIDAVTLSEDGAHTLVVSVSDEAGNTATSDPLSISAYDPYAHWSDEQVELMEEACGFIVPRSRNFAETTEVSEAVNIMETVLGVVVDGTGLSEEQIAEYEALLVREGFGANDYELAYFGETLVNATHMGVYDKLENGTTYQRLQNYYYEGEYYIEARTVSYSISHTWDEAFVTTVLGETNAAYLPEFSFASSNEDGAIFLTDYNSIMEGLGLTGAIQGKIYGVSTDELSTYFDVLTEAGYEDASITELEETGTVMPMFMDYETYAMVMIQISAYLEASTPFYSFDILCM